MDGQGMRSWRGLMWLVALIAFLPGCQREAAAPAAPDLDAAAYVRGEHVWRLERERALLADDGWTTLAGLHWLELRAHHLGNGDRVGLDLGIGPPRLGLVQQDAQGVTFTPEPGVAVTLDGNPLRGRVRMHSDRTPGPTVLGFDDGRGRLSLIERGDRRALRVRHLDAPARLRFAGLRFWPAAPTWRLPARFIAHPEARALEIVDIQGHLQMMANPGRLVFEREGRTWELEAVDAGDGHLMLMFADGTSGHGSYGAGRYLDLPTPGPDGDLVLDFNRAYNPPCAYSRHATCPLPPLDNRLRLAIDAGEQAYPGVAL